MVLFSRNQLLEDSSKSLHSAVREHFGFPEASQLDKLHNHKAIHSYTSLSAVFREHFLVNSVWVKEMIVLIGKYKAADI